LLSDSSRPIANPLAILRDDFDDWYVLFDPDLDTGFGLNAVGAFIWKRLDGQNTIQDIMAELRISCGSLPDGAEKIARDFVQNLVNSGLAGYELNEGWAETDRKSSDKREQEQIVWGIPALMDLGHRALNNVAAFVQSYPIRVTGGGCGCGVPCNSGSSATGNCTGGGIPDTFSGGS